MARWGYESTERFRGSGRGAGAGTGGTLAPQCAIGRPHGSLPSPAAAQALGRSMPSAVVRFMPQGVTTVSTAHQSRLGSRGLPRESLAVLAA
jgi:hypothetical protein